MRIKLDSNQTLSSIDLLLQIFLQTTQFISVFSVDSFLVCQYYYSVHELVLKVIVRHLRSLISRGYYLYKYSCFLGILEYFRG